MTESSKSINKGKRRDPLDERFASSKKQKIVHGDAAWVVAVEIETKTRKKNKSVNKQETSSNDKQEDEKKGMEKKPVKESSCQESSDEEEPKKTVAAETKSKGKDDSSGEPESQDRSDEERKISSMKQSVVYTSEKHDGVSEKPEEAEMKNIITMEECNKPKSLLPPRAGGSKLVYMENLSPSIKESDVVEFFKDAGKIDWVTFEKAGDSFLGYGHVKFDTSEAAQKALKRTGKELIGRAIVLAPVMEGTIFDNLTPSSQHKYLVLGNLTPDVKESDIIEFLKDAGKVVSVRLRHEGDNFFAHVQFASSTAAHEAIRRCGKKLHGRYVKRFLSTEIFERDSYTPSRRRFPGFRVLIGHGYGPTKVGFRCNCTLPVVSRIIEVPRFPGCENDQSRCRSCLGLMEEPKKPVAAETKAKKDDWSGEFESEDISNEEDIVKNRSVEGSDVDSSYFKENDSDGREEPKLSSMKQSVVYTAEKRDGVSEKPVEAETKNIITMEECNKPQSLLPPRAGGSKLVYMENLSPSIKESDVVEFFKDAGKIDWVTFEKAGDSFLGYGHVKFDTSEAAQKALKRTGKELIGRAIVLAPVMEGTIFDNLTPSSQHKYLVLGNLTPDVKESDIIEFLKDAGKVVSVRLGHEGDNFFAHVQFASSTAAHEAIRRCGKKLHGRYVKRFLSTEMFERDSYTASRRRPQFGVLRCPYPPRVRFLF